MAANNITLYRGRTQDFNYAHTDTTGAPVSLVGCTLYFTVKPTEFDTNTADTSALIKKTVGPGEHDNAAAGLTSFTLKDNDTYVAPGKYYYDVIIENAQGLAEPPSLSGRCLLIGTPTNRNVGNEL